MVKFERGNARKGPGPQAPSNAGTGMKVAGHGILAGHGRGEMRLMLGKECQPSLAFTNKEKKKAKGSKV